MLDKKKTYVTGALIMAVSVAQTFIEYYKTGVFNPLSHAEEFLGGLGLIFLRRGVKKEAEMVKDQATFISENPQP